MIHQNKMKGRKRMVLIAFELSMPNVGSWNGKWTGEGRPYIRVREVDDQKAASLLEEGSFDYRWDDGWCAYVSVRQVDTKEAAKLRKKSVGFLGYDWMIDSILAKGSIQKR